MRATPLIPALTTVLFLATSPALALPIELTFEGTLTTIARVYRTIGVSSGDAIKGSILYDSETPRDSDTGGGSRYEDPFLAAWIRIGDDAYTLGHRQGCCDSIFVGPEVLSFNIALTDAPDVMRFETLQLDIDPGGPVPYAFAGPLPTRLSSKELEPARIGNRLFGDATDPNDAGSTRLALQFDLDRVDVRPFEGDLDKIRDGDRPRDPKTPPVPEPGTALLLGLGLAALANPTRDAD